MKAIGIKPGDVIDGWTVTDIFDAMPPFVLLMLEREAWARDGTKASRRTWYRADEEVEVSRG